MARESQRDIEESPAFLPKMNPNEYGQHADTHQMVFELQGTVHELKGIVGVLQGTVEKGFEGIEKTLTDHNKHLAAISRIIWLVTGGSIVIGALVGLVGSIGLKRIAAILSALGGS
jgi:hypothetical protein